MYANLLLGRYLSTNGRYTIRTFATEFLSSLANSFDGGVTSIQSHPYVEHLIAVGR